MGAARCSWGCPWLSSQNPHSCPVRGSLIIFSLQGRQLGREVGTPHALAEGRGPRLKPSRSVQEATPSLPSSPTCSETYSKEGGTSQAINSGSQAINSGRVSATGTQAEMQRGLGDHRVTMTSRKAPSPSIPFLVYVTVTKCWRLPSL